MKDVCLEDFCLGQIDRWCCHLTEAIETHHREPERIQLIRYLDRTPYDSNRLSLITSFFGLQVPTQLIDNAINSFRKFLRELNGFSNTSYRRGSNEDARTQLNRRTVKFIERRTHRLYQAAVDIDSFCGA
ncbi:MAG: hypothetical protein ABGX16_01035 [Pirellulales bacterium]